MAEYVIIVTADNLKGLPALDAELILRGFETTIVPQAAVEAFVLPRGVYHHCSDLPIKDIHNAVVVALHKVGMDGAVLVLDINGYMAQGHPRWGNIHADQPVRP